MLGDSQCMPAAVHHRGESQTPRGILSPPEAACKGASAESVWKKTGRVPYTSLLNITPHKESSHGKCQAIHRFVVSFAENQVNV